MQISVPLKITLKDFHFVMFFKNMSQKFFLKLIGLDKTLMQVTCMFIFIWALLNPVIDMKLKTIATLAVDTFKNMLVQACLLFV